ncbi:alpha/beta hydrolase [Sphingomonas mollis]|uniref:Alpha/beta hydrolase n=1 Tax=Sphingomonas mollis TaxID=2795726 RepID=A0ABS0XK38_9SPHN|nr:alpha/beta hydrolase [Sphingomonas sp. BT553]MBJ6120401.1 alpha/beta hydrolase [Sphingomonas sp. BT553]
MAGIVTIDRRALIAGALIAPVVLPATTRAATMTPRLFADAGQRIDLWSGTAPGAPSSLPVETVDERTTIPDRPDRVVYGIARPRIVAFRPERPNGAAVLIVPGGGYRWLAVDKGGYQIASWLVDHGFTAFVLIHRLPGEGWADRADVPLADAQRAIRLIRHRATVYGIEPDRVAVMGLSAGGHACADLANRFAAATYAPVDAADRLSARPCCAAPIYPVVSMDPRIAHPGSREKLLGPDPSATMESAHSVDRNVTAKSPPHFLVHAEDDASVPVDNSLQLRAALRRAGVSVDTHLFAEGGHGFGLWNIAGKPVAAWPDLWLGWSRRIGLA